MSGKGDWIPGTNDAAYSANYPTIDWNAREREAYAEMVRQKIADRCIAVPHEIQSRLCRCPTTDQRRYCAGRDNCLRAEAL